ncbi:MAG: 4Fe-4S binding protein [Candidatus Bathyarchaeia archaeon]
MKKITPASGWRDLPLGGYILEPGSALEYKTGDWKAFKPIVDENACVNCLLCWIYCPDAAIKRRDKKVYVDYDYCKGCGICAQVCPVHAIKMIEER